MCLNFPLMGSDLPESLGIILVCQYFQNIFMITENIERLFKSLELFGT